MKLDHVTEFEDRRNVTMHGKDITDDNGSAVSGIVKKSFDNDYGEGSQKLVHHLATKYPCLKTEHHTQYFEENKIYDKTNIHVLTYLKMQMKKNLLLVALDIANQAKITIVVTWDHQKKQLNWNGGNVFVDTSLILNFFQDVL